MSSLPTYYLGISGGLPCSKFTEIIETPILARFKYSVGKAFLFYVSDSLIQGRAELNEGCEGEKQANQIGVFY
jgi:hypothetical protein